MSEDVATLFRNRDLSNPEQNSEVVFYPFTSSAALHNAFSELRSDFEAKSNGEPILDQDQDEGDVEEP